MSKFNVTAEPAHTAGENTRITASALVFSRVSFAENAVGRSNLRRKSVFQEFLGA
jgi:hypothetical protein